MAEVAAEVSRGSRSGADRRVLVALVDAAALLWGSSRLTWVTATITDDLRGTRTDAVSGSQWAAELTPLALVALAWDRRRERAARLLTERTVRLVLQGHLSVRPAVMP